MRGDGDAHTYGGFPKLGLLFWGPNNIITFWSPYWGTPYLGNLPYIYIYVYTCNQVLRHKFTTLDNKAKIRRRDLECRL